MTGECRPCGACPRCLRARGHREEARLLKTVLRNALKHIDALADRVEIELSVAGPAEVRQHPGLRHHQRVVEAARKAATAIRARLGGGP